jgi:hypothetical protein
MVCAKALRKIFSRSSGTPGGAMKGRPTLVRARKRSSA